MKPGTRVEATSPKSKHFGQKGTVIADYGNYLMVELDDQDYHGAFKNSAWGLKTCQLDRRFITKIKGTHAATCNT